MSGHSHWAKIKRSKAANDDKRGRIWSKLARRIIVAAKAGGGKPEDNLTLRYAIDDAKAANMPNDTIAKAIKKGTGEGGTTEYVSVLYEGYGPGGVAFMVECLTDNRNRTAAEMRKIFERANGQLGAGGCVAWMFEQKGSIVIAEEDSDEDTLMEIALEAGADDVLTEAELFTITCDVSAYSALRDALTAKEIKTVSSEIGMIPSNSIDCDLAQARKMLALMETLEDHDDVQNVFANFDISDDVAAEMEQE